MHINESANEMVAQGFEELASMLRNGGVRFSPAFFMTMPTLMAKFGISTDGIQIETTVHVDQSHIDDDESEATSPEEMAEVYDLLNRILGGSDSSAGQGPSSAQGPSSPYPRSPYRGGDC